MKKSSARSPRPNALAGMGVSPVWERIYRTLLRHEGGTVAELATKLNLPTRHIGTALRALEDKGMVTHSLDRVRRYFALPPDVAVEALIARDQHETEDRQRGARTAIVELSEAIDDRANGHGASQHIVEILSRQAAGAVFSQMRRTAQHEILCMERLPMLVSDASEPDEVTRECLKRGVRCRTLADNSLVTRPGFLDVMRMGVAQGEQYRVAASLPFKLVVADRHVGILPLDLTRPDGPVLLVRSSSLLDALCELFERLWQAGTPVSASEEGEEEHEQEILRHNELLKLLALGLNDKAIEHELKVSSRTLTRRIDELAKKFGAATRFQLGWRAARLDAG
jgi:sugar-specific transcriptional regulator TrmB